MELKIPVTAFQFFIIVWSVVMISSGCGISYEYDHKILFQNQDSNSLYNDDSFTNIGLITCGIFGFGFVVGIQVILDHYKEKIHIRMPRISVRFKDD